MKNYTITVNGVAYEVTVEEGAGTGAPVAAAPNGDNIAFPLEKQKQRSLKGDQFLLLFPW